MIGKTLDHYRLVEKIGAGGMGEVYRARDSKLGREVAVKVLPEAFASHPERLVRFEHEACLLAALNHPNIAAIYGLEESNGVRFLVLELVPGQTLAERLTKGPLPLEEALTVCRQIAEALEAAHERGILHRDLKPGNVKVTPEGKVKVLDFGLAKAMGPGAPEKDLTQSPTLTSPPTQEGVLLGTAAYMSPEQARGKPLDKRTDIWSFGCVLYEALSGRQAFSGETVSDTIAKILEREPDWSALPANTPPKVREVLRRCLQKDASRRLHHIADARIEIEEFLSGPTVPAPIISAVRPVAWQRAFPWILALVVAAIAATVAWNLKPSHQAAPQPPMRFTVALPPSAPLVLAPGTHPSLALSPDNAHLVYAGRVGTKNVLHVRAMNRLDVAPIAGSEEATIPFFSPDGQWVGFFAGGKLKKIPLAGGPGVTLCEARWGGASWGPDDTIIFTPEYNQGLSRVSAVGGTPQVLTTPDRSAGEFAHWWPEILPDGKAVLFTVWTTARFEEARIAVLSLETGKKRVLIEGGTHPRYVQSGHLLYAKGDTLMAVPFDASRLEVTGTPMPVVEGVMIDTFGGFAHYSTARDGTVVYIPSSAEARRLVWVDRRGKEVLLSEEQRRFETPRLSPDGKRVAVAIHEPNPDVWVLDLTRTTLTRLTFDPASEFVPVWTPDGRRLAFIHDTPPFDLFWKAADGSGAEEPLFKSEHDKYPNSWSPDGRVLAFTEQDPVTGPDVWLLPLHGERKPQPFLRTRFEEGAAAFSPDGRWLAYTSNETGRFEIYVQPYPGPGPKSQISTAGGTEPAWSRNGRELFYRNGQKMMAVSVTTQPTFRAGKPSLLFQGPLSAGRPNRLVNYDVSPDGQRLLMILHSQEEAAPTQLNVVLNWFEELKRRVPAGKK